MSNVFITAEIGLNHNGSIDLALQMIREAKRCGADAVKFQKRTIELCYTAEELAASRESPFGTTNGDLKRKLEFGEAEYDAIDAECRKVGVPWFASPWDLPSLDFIQQYDTPFIKIPSARLTDAPLLIASRSDARKQQQLILSTGGADLDMIECAVETCYPDWLLHCCAAYPAPYPALNLRCIADGSAGRAGDLRKRFGNLKIGYSGHEDGIATTVAAVALGAEMIERHFTLSRSMYGSDQSASLGPAGFEKMVRDVRLVEQALGDGVKKVEECEKPIMAKLRR